MTPAGDFLRMPRAAAPAPRSRGIGLNLLVALAYALTGAVGLRLAFVGKVVTLFWPPSGIAFAAIWLGGPGLIPGVLLGAFAVNLTVFHAAYPACLVALGNLMPALVSRHFLLKLLHGRGSRGELPQVIAFLVLAVLVSTTLSASAGTVAVLLSGQSSASLESTWVVWWMGDAMGVLIVAPPLLLWSRLRAGMHHLPTVAAAAGFAAMGLCLIAGLLLIHGPIWAVELCKLLTLLLSLWAGARFGLPGPALMTLLTSVGAIAVTLLGVGPFMRGDFYDRFALVHSFLFAQAVAALLLAAAMADLQRAAASEREARDIAERASANRTRLLNMISHDVRTPLSGMVGVFQTLSRTPLDADLQPLIGLGLRAGASLGKLVDDILMAARVEAGRITLEEAPFDLRQSLEDVVAHQSAEAAAKSLALSLHVDPSVPPALVGDRVRVEQVMGNLLGNAVRYTSSGTVTLHARWDSGQSGLELTVQDSGPGIRMPGEPALSDPTPHGRDDVFSGGARIAAESVGLGLGLPICRTLVNLMRGTIRYAGAPGQGSRFDVWLPLPAVSTAAGTGLGTDQARALRAQRILVVEDDDIAREVVVSQLAAHGFQVSSSPSAEHALRQAEAQDYALVLLDLHLGRGAADGFALARQIRALPGGSARARLVMLTGSPEEAALHSSRAAGIDAVWPKPLVVGPVLEALLTSAPLTQ